MCFSHASSYNNGLIWSSELKQNNFLREWVREKKTYTHKRKAFSW